MTSVVKTATGTPSASVQCDTGMIALGGGGDAGANGLTRSAPINSGGSVASAGNLPTGWNVTTALGPVTVYAICANGPAV
jgi:hypothetical protein